MRRFTRTTRGGFSLLEVVIVVAIIAILAAIGIPRMSRGSRGANDSALSGDLAVLRNAIDLYSAEHGGLFPTAGQITSQLTQYTDVSGNPSLTKGSPYIYGPYIRTIPPIPVGWRKGKNGITASDDPNTGWLYDATAGKITANATTTDKDDSGKLYSDY
ncbi:MAG: prepilin-type N-terminal cleavage/methylation domain-containing protein [Sedimentisphaerales bacterium]|nr:prepilin-type N-terminal cleavage/methylation domain-containing protein [Sedimentisphaerales bacterium]